MKKIIPALFILFWVFINHNFVKAEENDYLASQDPGLPIVTLTPTPTPSFETRPTLGPTATLTPTSTPRVTIVQPECTDGERECVSVSQSRVCHNGYWVLEAPCDFNEECVSGKCIPRTDPSPTRFLPTTTDVPTATDEPFNCYQCETQEQGDADCDTFIELDDFAAWLEVYKGEGGDKSMVDFVCSPDDGQHIIDQADFRLWLDFFLLEL